MICSLSISLSAFWLMEQDPEVLEAWAEEHRAREFARTKAAVSSSTTAG